VLGPGGSGELQLRRGGLIEASTKATLAIVYPGRLLSDRRHRADSRRWPPLLEARRRRLLKSFGRETFSRLRWSPAALRNAARRRNWPIVVGLADADRGPARGRVGRADRWQRAYRGVAAAGPGERLRLQWPSADFGDLAEVLWTPSNKVKLPRLAADERHPLGTLIAYRMVKITFMG